MNDPRLQEIKRLNATALLPTAQVDCYGIPFTGTFGTGLPFGVAQYAAKDEFRTLVADRMTWDFKHEIRHLLGQGITLCALGGICEQDIEYSVPGNLHFGFVAREAGYPESLIKYEAADADINDPSHELPENHPGYAPYTGQRYLNGPGGVNLGDDPQDNFAVNFGIQLYNRYGRALSLATFRMEVGQAFSGFAKHAPDSFPLSAQVTHAWPYPVGFFDPTTP